MLHGGCVFHLCQMEGSNMKSSFWFSIFTSALQGTATNCLMSKSKIIRNAIAIADEAERQFNELEKEVENG